MLGMRIVGVGMARVDVWSVGAYGVGVVQARRAPLDVLTIGRVVVWSEGSPVTPPEGGVQVRSPRQGRRWLL